jgi:hypothetical protein
VNQKAEKSEMAFSDGKLKNFDEFNNDFENWKAQKRAYIK